MGESVTSPAGLSRLKEEQERSLASCKQRIDQWKRFENDYLNLKSFMGTVADKISHDVLVPFGNLALMPGQLVNTNNVLVLLGDNWFVERSTKQASEIAERRLKSCKDTLSQLEMEREQIESWMKYTEMSFSEDGVKDIVGEYDPVRDKSWREKRMKDVHSVKKSDGSSSAVKSQRRPSKVRWEDEENSQVPIISFTHSDKAPPDTLQFKDPVKTDIVSPADIWYVFGSPSSECKSILKPTKPSKDSVVEPVIDESPPVKNELPTDMSNQAFTGTIIEKASTEVTSQNKENASRPISRFKARKSKK